MTVPWQQKLNDLLKRFSLDIGMIYRLDPQDNFLYMLACIGNFPENILQVMSKIPPGKGIAGETAKAKEAIVCFDLTGNDAPACARPMAKTLGIKGMISLPIMKNDTVVGTVGVGNYYERKFTPEEIQEITTLVNNFADEIDKIVITK